jgi:hypothetical protein
LKGTLLLCLSEPLAVKHIRLQLTGMSRVWYVILQQVRSLHVKN